MQILRCMLPQIRILCGIRQLIKWWRKAWVCNFSNFDFLLPRIEFCCLTFCLERQTLVNLCCNNLTTSNFVELLAQGLLFDSLLPSVFKMKLKTQVHVLISYF